MQRISSEPRKLLKDKKNTQRILEWENCNYIQRYYRQILKPKFNKDKTMKNNKENRKRLTKQ